jgi:hypothetical protein
MMAGGTIGQGLRFLFQSGHDVSKVRRLWLQPPTYLLIRSRCVSVNCGRLLPSLRLLPDISLIRPGNGRIAETSLGGREPGTTGRLYLPRIFMVDSPSPHPRRNP